MPWPGGSSSPGASRTSDPTWMSPTPTPPRGSREVSPDVTGTALDAVVASEPLPSTGPASHDGPVTGFRLAELVTGLSVVSDLGKGLADGQGLRGCVLACDLADRAALGPEDRESAFWIGLLRFVGC